MKYEFTNQTNYNGFKRIKRIYDGLLGGFIESEDNLSHEGECWVSGNACVFGDAKVYESAQVYGDASVDGKAHIYGNSHVFENAQVYGHARIFGNAQVYEHTKIYGDAQVYGNAKVFGFAQIFGHAHVYGNTLTYGFNMICGNTRVFGDSTSENIEKIKTAFHPGKLDEIRIQKLIAGIKAINHLIHSSDGVTGFHLNGDIATWDELRAGGQFEGWLQDFDEALKVI